MERMEEREISLSELFGILRKRLLLILLLTALGAGAAFGISSILPKQYETFTTLLVGRPEGYQAEQDLNVNDILFNQKLVGTYAELIKSRSVAEKVNENLGLEMDFETFKEKVNVNLVNDTEVIRIVVRDTNALRAKDIANETASIFSETVVDAMKIDNIQVVDYAVEPENAVAPRILLNTALGAIIGMIIGMMIALLKEILDKTVKTPEDIEEKLGLTVIGSTPVIGGKEK